MFLSHITTPSMGNHDKLASLISTKGSKKEIYSLLFEIKESNQLDATFGPDKNTLLIVAIKAKNLDAVKILLELGADVNKRSGTTDTQPSKIQGFTPLWYSLALKKTRITELLLNKGADPDLSSSDYGCPPLIMAKEKNSSKQLLKKLETESSQIDHETRMLGLRFSLKTNHKRQLYFEGYFPKITFPVFFSSLQAFADTNFPVDTDKSGSWNKKFWKQILTSVNFEKYTIRGRYDTDRSVFASIVITPDHSQSLAVRKRCFILCDKANESPGLMIFRINNKINAANCISRLAKKNFDIQTLQAALAQLKLSDPIHIRHKKQTQSDNCAWLTWKLGFKAVAYLELRRKGYKHEAAIALSHRVFKAFCHFDRQQAIEKALENPKISVAALHCVLLKCLTLKNPAFALFMLQEKPELHTLAGKSLLGALYLNLYRKTHPEVMKFLIDSNPDLNSVKKNGTPLIMIDILHNPYTPSVLLKYLVSKDVDVNTTNNEGETALHSAVKLGTSREMIHFLIENGADKSLQSHKGLTAIDYLLLKKVDNEENENGEASEGLEEMKALLS